MGDECTRGCRFCSVKTSRTPKPLDPEEPNRVAEALAGWKDLDYIVITAVDRDDIVNDGGAGHFAQTVRKVLERRPKLLVETLAGDFGGRLESTALLAKAGMKVYAHNLETVERLTPHVRDRRAGYRQSLTVLEEAKRVNPSLVTKSSIMLGCGETDEEVLQTLKGNIRNIIKD